jgi:signal transduction histidine kinase
LGKDDPKTARLPKRLYGGDPRVKLQIVDAQGHSVLGLGLTPAESIAADRADVTTRFFSSKADASDGFESHFLTWRTGAATGTPTDRSQSSGEQQRVVGRVTFRSGSDSWKLLVQHSEGSLDQAVAVTRRRNLYLSFGILSVLVVAMGLVVGNAQRSQHLAAQQMEFVATVSHELRTPVAVIRSAAENLASGIVQEPAEARHYGELIESEGRRLTDTIEQVLTHADIRAKRFALHRADLDVAKLIEDTAHACAPAVSRAGMTMTVDVAANLPHLRADEPALRQALENLIGNAVKHAAEGRWIGIAARLARPDSRYVVRDRRRGSASRTRPIQVLEFVVSDRGPGIDRRDREHLFEAFYRGQRALERQIQGTGLGLSLVKRIVDDHGGRVIVASTPGGGATFSILLPVLPDPSELAAAPNV